jgi:hypothetical protein
MRFLPRLLLAVVLVAALQIPAARARAVDCNPGLGPCYLGYQTQGSFYGIDGYIRQSGTVPTTGLHADWFTILVPHATWSEWAQLGTLQGDFAGGNTEAHPSMYYENVDLCNSYHALTLTSPPTQDYAYYITYNNAGAHTFSCGGIPTVGYTYEYRVGSFTSSPIFYGVMSQPNGLAMAKTEIQGASTPFGTDYYGCTGTKVCTNQGYGLHLFNPGLWTTAYPTTTSHDVASWGLHSYNQYWSFATCPVAC